MTHVAFQNNTLNLPPQKELSSISEFANGPIGPACFDPCFWNILYKLLWLSMMLYFILQILILYNLSLQVPSACFVIIKQSFSAGKESYTKSYRKRKLYLSLITDVNIFHSSPISLKPSIVTFAISTFHYCFNKSSSQ